MSNRDLLARIATNKPGALVLAYRVLLLAAAVLLVDIVVAEPRLVEPVQAKDEPLYVGDFYGTSVGRQVEIVDDGPAIRRPYMHAPVDAEVIPPLLTSPRPAELQSRTSRRCEPSPVNASSQNAKRFDSSSGPIGDFPLPKLNFPREIGPAGKYALPMTSPQVMSVQAKPIGIGGAAGKGEAPRLRKPTNRRASASPIRTYSRGYVSGSSSTEDKRKGFR